MIGLSDNGEHDGVDFDSDCDGVSLVVIMMVMM